MEHLRAVIELPYKDFRSATIFNPKKKVKVRDTNNPNIIKRVVFHCTDATNWTPEKLSRFFIEERDFPVCGYHYYVTEEAVWHMVGENVVTYHAANWNSGSVAFSIDYHPTMNDALDIEVHPTIYENAIKIATYLCLKFNIAPLKGFLVGHRELQFTGWYKDENDNIRLRKTCPGMRIDLDIFRYKVARNIQMTLNKLVDSKLAVDGIFGPITLSEFKSWQGILQTKVQKVQLS